MQNSELEQFRNQWKNEIEFGKILHSITDLTLTPTVDVQEIIDQARTKYNEGISHEKSGNMAMAVNCYRQAIKMYPEVETEWKTMAAKQKKVKPILSDKSKSGTEFVKHLQEKLEINGVRFLPDKGSVCHLEKLPDDIINMILLYTIGQESDLLTLEKISLTSSAFYLYARGNPIWQVIFKKSTNVDVETDDYCNWKELFLSTPHIYFHGFYACKITYIRHGEQTMENNVLPWQTVVFYRVLKLNPDGSAYYVITPENPYSVYENNSLTTVKKKSAMHGNWSFKNNELFISVERYCELPKPARKHTRIRNAGVFKFGHGCKKQSFFLEFHLNKDKNDSYCLEWVENSLTYHHLDGTTVITKFEVDNIQQYSPLLFHPVAKSKCDQVLETENKDF